MREYLEKNWKKVLVYALILWYVFSHVMIVFHSVDTEEEMYEITTKAITHHKSWVFFKGEADPDDLYYEDMLDEAMEKDLYDACEFYEFKYRYTVNGDDEYKVRLSIKKPRAFRSILAKHRVKQIARRFSKLDSDYEKVKAVHDYIITRNEYFIGMGGSYSALCMGHSACNGYALAFYALMEELNIPVSYETGDDHMWNQVYLDGEWYNIDLTWDDPGDGRVHYDYFLKCDADWNGHAYGGATAEKSMPVTGKSAKEYVKMVPNYLLIDFMLLVLVIGGGIYAAGKISKKLLEKKRQQKALQEKLLEQSIRASREQELLDRQFEDM